MASTRFTWIFTDMSTNKTPGQVLRALQPGSFVTLQKVQPLGALQARKQANGTITFYWRYTYGATSERPLIGPYDVSAPPKSLKPTDRGYSIAAAVRAAEQMALQHHQHREEGGRPALVASERKARQMAAEVQAQAAEHTLAKLCDEYCDYLESLGRTSHSDVRSIFKLHVKEAWPQEAALPAGDVTPEQIADMMRRLLDAGKGRTSNKLRSYLHAAYQVARSARSKPSIPVAFKGFGIKINPVSDTTPDEAQNNPAKNPLSEQELRTDRRIIRDLPGFTGAVLRLHLLTGSQRIAQFVRLRTPHIAAAEILLFDGKGRPGRPPREHPVPLIKAAAKALKECAPQGEYALSTDGGKTHLSPTTLSKWAAEAAGEAIENFQAKRLRSGVETVLAKAKISGEMRGRLQSHGIAGVQARHYDGHDYMDEKRQALLALYELLEQPDTGKADSSKIGPHWFVNHNSSR